MSFKANVVRFVLKLSNILLLLMGVAMGLYALSTYTEYKNLKSHHDGRHNLTLAVAPTAAAHDLLSLGGAHILGSGNNNNLDFLNNTRVPVYITGLGGAGVFTTLAAATGLYASETGSPFCLNLYSLELFVMLVFQITVVALVYTHNIYIPEDQKKSAEHSKFAKFLEKQEKVSRILALSMLFLQVLCIFMACTLKSMKWKPRDEFEFDADFDTSASASRRQPLLHFSDPDRSSGSAKKKNKRKKGKKARAIRDKYYDDV